MKTAGRRGFSSHYVNLGRTEAQAPPPAPRLPLRADARLPRASRDGRRLLAVRGRDGLRVRRLSAAAVPRLARRASRRSRKAPITPTVTMVIAAYNEEQAIAGKLDNSLALDYPADRLDILVASDGSNDGTNRIVREYEARHPGRVTLLDLPRGGKTVGQNHAADVASGEILVFSDATHDVRRGRRARDGRELRRPAASAASAATSATCARARRRAPRAGRCTGTTRRRSAAGRARSSP